MHSVLVDVLSEALLCIDRASVDQDLESYAESMEDSTSRDCFLSGDLRVVLHRMLECPSEWLKKDSLDNDLSILVFEGSGVMGRWATGVSQSRDSKKMPEYPNLTLALAIAAVIADIREHDAVQAALAALVLAQHAVVAGSAVSRPLVRWHLEVIGEFSDVTSLIRPRLLRYVAGAYFVFSTYSRQAIGSAFSTCGFRETVFEPDAVQLTSLVRHDWFEADVFLEPIWIRLLAMAANS